MNISEHNRKVAISRWSKVHATERKQINYSEGTLLTKALLCGMLAGDGSMQCRSRETYYSYEVHCFPDDVLMRNSFIEGIHQIYGKIPRVIPFGKMERVRITSRTIYEDLTRLAVFGIHSWTVPAFVRKSRALTCAWLRGFFSAEGYVGKKTVRIQTVNQKGMDDISDILAELQIEHKRYVYDSKNSKNSRVHIIIIMKKEARKKYFDKIGFCHTRKTACLRQALGL